MDKLSLAALLDEDREMVLANIAADRSLPAAQAALEKAIDRVMYRYVERCDDEAQRDCAQHVLQTMKNTLPMMDTVGEAKIWKKQYEAPKKGVKLRPLGWACLVAGGVLVLAAALGALIAGRMSGPLALLRTLLPAVLGGGALFWAGIQAGRPDKKRESPDDAAVRTEYLVDAEKAWHCLRGAMLLADGQLERVREEGEAKRQQQAMDAPAGEVPPKALELFAELLESAYATEDENAREAAASIRFYLHNAGVDALDYEQGREGWFEFLPAAKPGTIRPALAAGGRLLRKGLASDKR